MKLSMKYFPIIFSILVFYVSFLMIKPFINAIITAMILTYIFYPFYSKIKKILKNDNLSIIVMVTLILLIVLLPMIMIFNLLLDDAKSLYNNLRTLNLEEIPMLTGDKFGITDKDLRNAVQTVALKFVNTMSGFVFSIPDKIVNSLIMVLAMAVFFKGGPEFVDKVKTIIPLDELQKDRFFKEIEIVVRSVVYSIIISAFFKSVMATGIFYLFRIPNYLVWGVFVFVLSFIPIIGNVPVWIGAGAYLFLIGSPIKAVLMLIACFIVNNVDDLIVAKVMVERAKINPLLTMIGVISGIKIFGIIGIFIGPLILSLSVSVIRFYTSNYKKGFEV